jgi:TolB-like protein
VSSEPLIEAAGLVADGAALDWASLSPRLSSDDQRALADELALVVTIAQQHWLVQGFLAETAAASAGRVPVPVVVRRGYPICGSPTLRKALVVAGVMALMFAAALLTWKLLPRRVAIDSPPARSIAVLPICNLTGDPAKTYLANDLTEVVISHLSRVRALDVASFGALSVHRHQALSAAHAKPLRPHLILAGSLVDAGGRFGIVMHLIDPVSDRVLWSREFRPELSGLLAVPGDIARELAALLSAPHASL